VNILVIEDDDLVAEFTKRALKTEDHFVSVVRDGSSGFKKASKGSYDAIVLDVLLPGKDGLTVCSELRRSKVATPIIILSSQGDEASMIAGLDAGADDYMVKPFNHKELSARIRAVTRRPSVVSQSKLVVDDLVLSPEDHRVLRGKREVVLRPKEYELLEYMMRNPGVVLHRYALLSKIWHVRSEATSNRLEVYIRQLRQGIDSGQERKLIHTVRGVGYRIGDAI